MEKGTYGYMDQYKRSKLRISAVFLVLIAVCITAILLLCQTKNTFYIVIPIVLALPFAKFFVSFVVVQSYVTMAQESYDQVAAFVEMHAHSIALYDVTLASEAGISYLDFALIIDGTVYACASHANRKFSPKDIQAYLDQIVQKAGYSERTFVYQGVEETLQAARKRMQSIPDTHVFRDSRSENIKKAILVMNV